MLCGDELYNGQRWHKHRAQHRAALLGMYPVTLLTSPHVRLLTILYGGMSRLFAGLAAVAAQRLGGSSLAALGPQAPAAGADVFVCDALHLAYRPCSCDGLLCIAVLHHISSRQRRLELLQQLGAVLRPGGRGLVTVWATAQEDPAKTIQRWHKIQPGTLPQRQQEDCQQQQQQEVADAGAEQQQQQATGQEAEGPDYFVPWHLPFHKAGALAATAQQSVPAAGNGVANDSLQVSGAKGGVAVDASKGAVVLQRYYHLFEEGELEGLVEQVPGLSVVQVFYDRSNWCVEFRKEE